MNKTKIITELKELFDLYKSLNKPSDDPDEVFPFEEMFIERPEKIYSYFGLKSTKKLDDILDKFLQQDELTPESIEKVIDCFTEIATEQLSMPVQPHSVKYRQRQFNKKSMNDIPLSAIGSKMHTYVMKNILIPLTDAEFIQIEHGFRLLWNNSTGKMVGDGDFKNWVNQYLLSIEFQIDQKKVKKVVDLILEYMEEIGQWG